MDEDIRQMLQTKSSRAPVLLEPPPAVLRRARVRRAANGLAAGAVAAAVVLGALTLVNPSSRKAEPVSPPGVVPWLEGPHHPGRGVSVCRAADVAFSVDAGADVILRFRPKKADVRCHLWVVDYRVENAPGVFLPLSKERHTFADVVVEKGGTAVFADWEACAPSGQLTFHVHLLVNAEELMASATPLQSSSTCPPGRFPSDLKLVGSGPSSALRSTPIPGMDELVASIVAPESVTRGQTLVYEVALSNPTDHDILLLPCPTFSQTLSMDIFYRLEGGGTLNCDGTNGVIPAHSRVRFEMRLNVGDVQVGFSDLLWYLDRPSPVQASTEIRVS